jgi:hypothetical protein
MWYTIGVGGVSRRGEAKRGETMTMRYDNYSVFVLIAERGVSETAFYEAVRERAQEEGAEVLLFFAEPDGFLTAYFVAPATDRQRSAGIIIPFQQALSFILNREGYPVEEEEIELPLVYTERVFVEEDRE